MIVLGDDMARRLITKPVLDTNLLICETISICLFLEVWFLEVWWHHQSWSMSQSTIPDINVNIWSVWWHHLEVYLDG